ncbi:hypothetical protein [Priestia aryabhattai]
MGDSGADSYRGYKAQTLITLLEALKSGEWDKWESFTLEPKNEPEIVDITFRYPDYTSYYQVKSSKNEFKKGASLKVLEELRRKTKPGSTDKVRLVLVGEADFEHSEVTVTPLNLTNMLKDLALLLRDYLSFEYFESLDEGGLDVLSSALVTNIEISTLAERSAFTRKDFRDEISGIMKSLIKDKELDMEHFSNLIQFKGWLNQLVHMYNVESDQATYSVLEVGSVDNRNFSLENAYLLIKDVANDTILWAKFKDIYSTLIFMNDHLNRTVDSVKHAGEEIEVIGKLDENHNTFKEANKKDINKVIEFHSWLNKHKDFNA